MCIRSEKNAINNATEPISVYCIFSKDIISMLNFLSLKVALWLSKRMSWFLGDWLKLLGIKDHDICK